MATSLASDIGANCLEHFGCWSTVYGGCNCLANQFLPFAGAQAACIFVFALSLPWLLGYSVIGLLSFPPESEFAAGVAQMIGKLVN